MPHAQRRIVLAAICSTPAHAWTSLSPTLPDRARPPEFLSAHDGTAKPGLSPPPQNGIAAVYAYGLAAADTFFWAPPSWLPNAASVCPADAHPASSYPHRLGLESLPPAIYFPKDALDQYSADDFAGSKLLGV